MFPLATILGPFAKRFFVRLMELPRLAILGRFLVFYLIVGIIFSGLGAELVGSLGMFTFLGIQASTVHLALFLLWPAVLSYLSPDYALLTLFALVGAAAYAVHLRERCDSAERERVALEETASILRLELESLVSLPSFSGSTPAPGNVIDLTVDEPVAASASRVSEMSDGT